MTAGLSSAQACVRVIIRDVAGKHSWDSAVLYGPPPCSPSSPAHAFPPHTHSPLAAGGHPRTPPGGPPRRPGAKRDASQEEEREAEAREAERRSFQEEDEEEDEEGEGGDRKVSEEEERSEQEGERPGEEEEEEEGERGELELILAPPSAKRVCREAVPAWDSLGEGDDALDEMLQYLGYSSPECLQRAGTSSFSVSKSSSSIFRVHSIYPKFHSIYLRFTQYIQGLIS